MYICYHSTKSKVEIERDENKNVISFKRFNCFGCINKQFELSHFYFYIAEDSKDCDSFYRLFMIKDFENISKFRSEPDLNSLISEANKVYAVALNKKIEEKEKLNENCDEEKEKLKYLKDIDKIDIRI